MGESSRGGLGVSEEKRPLRRQEFKRVFGARSPDTGMERKHEGRNVFSLSLFLLTPSIIIITSPNITSVLESCLQSLKLSYTKSPTLHLSPRHCSQQEFNRWALAREVFRHRLAPLPICTSVLSSLEEQTSNLFNYISSSQIRGPP